MYIWNNIKNFFKNCMVNLFNLDNKKIDESDIYIEDIIEIINDI